MEMVIKRRSSGGKLANFDLPLDHPRRRAFGPHLYRPVPQKAPSPRALQIARILARVRDNAPFARFWREPVQSAEHGAMELMLDVPRYPGRSGGQI